MKKFLRNNGAALILIAILLAAVIGVGSSILGFNPIASVINAIGTPIRAVSTAVTNWTQDRYDRLFRYEQMEEEVEQLRQQLAELEEAARNGEEAAREVIRLRDLLGLSNERPELSYLDATVTQRSSSNWGSDLTLNKGSVDGVELHDCVIDQYGNVVGIVTEVGLNWALVTTVLDPTADLGGRISRVDENTLLEGDFTLMQQGLLTMTYLTSESRIVTGDQVVTSGLADLYPAGLTVGTVISLHTAEDGISRYAVIQPSADIQNIRYVYIVTDF